MDQSRREEIIQQSSFLCHPISDHGIDHEAISMRKKYKRFLSTAVALKLFCIRYSDVRMMAIININLVEKRGMGTVCS